MRTGLALPASTRDTPVVRSTTSFSPRMHVRALADHTLPSSVTVLDFMSNSARSPVAVWSFWVTMTPPLASSRLICDEPPGPGVAAGMVCAGAPGLAAVLALCS